MPLEATQCASELIYTVTSVNFSLGPSCARIQTSSFLMTYPKAEPDCGKRSITGISLMLLAAIFPRNTVQCAFFSFVSGICSLPFRDHFAHRVSIFINELLKMRHRNAFEKVESTHAKNFENIPKNLIFLLKFLKKCSPINIHISQTEELRIASVFYSTGLGSVESLCEHFAYMVPVCLHQFG